MSSNKVTKKQRIAELERQLAESNAQHIHHHHFAAASLPKAGEKSMMGSGVIITVTALGGKPIVEPILIRNGLSSETIAALQDDIVRSYKYATELKPKGA